MLLFAAFAALPSCAGDEEVRSSSSSNNSTLYGFSPFPYEASLEAIDKTYELTREYGQISVIQIDNGIPWFEALNGLPFPKSVEDKWKEIDTHRDSTEPTYLALAPLGEDRETLINGSEGSQDRSVFTNTKLNAPDVVRAYTAYARIATARFQPRFVNLGLEAGELAYRNPSRWPEFEDLFRQVVTTLRREFPNTKFGISFGLQSLLEPNMLQRVKPVLDASDYLGLSFYPYMSPFHERYGIKALPAPPDQWREPLTQIAKVSPLPIAITETGYTSRPVRVDDHNLEFTGSEALQDLYLQDMAQAASQHGFLFVVWFMPVDYENLFETITPSDDAYKIWQYIGLFDSELRAKPAWNRWLNIIGGNDTARGGTALQTAVPQGTAPQGAAPQHQPVFEVVSASAGPEFVPSEHDRITVIDAGPEVRRVQFSSKGLHWSYSYEAGRWQWATKKLAAGSLANRSTMHLQVRSDKAGPILVQLEETGGETFFTVIQPERDWQEISVPFNRFQLDPAKKQDGRLAPEDVVTILLADAGAVTEGAIGNRTIWFANWRFE